jgi:peptidoglycan/LPS O-acetylase OafA/YrhL
VSGYYQLYYLLVIMQFYVVYPALLWLLRRTEGHHGLVLAVSFVVQVVWMSLMHWGVLPGALQGFSATREVTSYQFYLVAGMVVARHLDAVHGWLCRNGWKIFWATTAAAVVAEAWFVAADRHLVPGLGSGSDPFQPIVIPYNIGAIACLYLFGVWLVAPGRSARLRAIVRSGSDNAYGIYLAQMLFILTLSWLSWRSLDRVVPWPIVAVVTVAVVVLGCVLLTSVLARTPLAVALTGRARERWDTWLPAGWRPPGDDPEVEVEESSSPIDLDEEPPGIPGRPYAVVYGAALGDSRGEKRVLAAPEPGSRCRPIAAPLMSADRSSSARRG